MYFCAWVTTAWPVGTSMWRFWAPALSTTTLPTFNTEVLIATTFGALAFAFGFVVVVVLFFFPPEQAARKSTSTSTSATPVERAGAVVPEVRSGFSTGDIFPFARG